MDGQGPVRRPAAQPERSGRHRGAGLYLVRSPAGPAPLAVETVDVLYVVLVRVSGVLDADTAPRLTTVLRPLEGRHCELDLARVPFMDSAGLAPLLDHRRRAHTAGGHLRVVDLSSAVWRLLDLTQTIPLLLTDPRYES